jgi:hypothetical protein
METCTACGIARAARVRLVRARQGPTPGTAEQRHALCESCGAWLWSLFAAARNEDAGLVGAPPLNGRRLVFDDQCQVCRQIPPGPGVLVSMESRLRHLPGWPPLLLCPACDGWLAGLACDGRSARNQATRELDGPYGAWLYPNLAGIEAVIRVTGQSGRSIEASCREMELSVVAEPAADAQVVYFLEPADSEGFATARAPGTIAVVAVAPFSAEFRLREDMLAGVTDWITDPPTPQQVTRAIVHARRFPAHQLAYDSATLLPFAVDHTVPRIALLVRPGDGSPAFETGWLLRRLSRGYDEIAALRSGAIVAFPRVAAAQVADVAHRLQTMLMGRATVTPLGDQHELPQRFEATG